MSIAEFLKLIFSDWFIFITVAVTLGVAFVSGWTDAPNAISSCVVTRSLNMKQAVILAAICDFLGSVVMGVFSGKVTQTIVNLANFGSEGVPAMCAAMISVVIWAVSAWFFGIPTSESHALMAALFGSGVAVSRNLSCFDSAEWIKVIYGLALSLFLGFASGFISSFLTVNIFSKQDKSKSDNFFARSQIASSALMAFMHGAQDSQKFTGILMLFVSMTMNKTDAGKAPLWMLLLSPLAIALGTASGGARIIKSVGMDMIKMRRDMGFSADMAGAFCLFLSTVLGLPVSTTHTKTSAVLGVGAYNGVKSVNWSVAFEMLTAWILTFPGCAILSYIITSILCR